MEMKEEMEREITRAQYELDAIVNWINRIMLMDLDRGLAIRKIKEEIVKIKRGRGTIHSALRKCRDFDVLTVQESVEIMRMV